jgi:hypothetical protein
MYKNNNNKSATDDTLKNQGNLKKRRRNSLADANAEASGQASSKKIKASRSTELPALQSILESDMDKQEKMKSHDVHSTENPELTDLLRDFLKGRKDIGVQQLFDAPFDSNDEQDKAFIETLNPKQIKLSSSGDVYYHYQPKLISITGGGLFNTPPATSTPLTASESKNNVGVMGIKRLCLLGAQNKLYGVSIREISNYVQADSDAKKNLKMLSDGVDIFAILLIKRNNEELLQLRIIENTDSNHTNLLTVEEQAAFAAGELALLGMGEMYIKNGIPVGHCPKTGGYHHKLNQAIQDKLFLRFFKGKEIFILPPHLQSIYIDILTNNFIYNKQDDPAQYPEIKKYLAQLYIPYVHNWKALEEKFKLNSHQQLFDLLLSLVKVDGEAIKLLQQLNSRCQTQGLTANQFLTAELSKLDANKRDDFKNDLLLLLTVVDRGITYDNFCGPWKSQVVIEPMNYIVRLLFPEKFQSSSNEVSLPVEPKQGKDEVLNMPASRLGMN